MRFASIAVVFALLGLLTPMAGPSGAAASSAADPGAETDRPRVLAHHEGDAIVPGGRVFLLTDSVVLGAIEELGALLPGRTYTAVGYPGFHAWAAPSVLDDYPPRITDTVIIALGNNEFDSGRGAIDSMIEDVMDVLADTSQVIWVRPRRWHSGMYRWNDALTAAYQRHDNLELADWPGTVHGHPEFIYSDGIHLRPAGQWAMARLLDDHIRGRVQLPGRGIRATLAPVRSTPRGVRVKGWALDLEDETPVEVRVRLDGNTAVAVIADLPRPDVAAQWNRGPDHGFELLVPRVVDGRRQVCVQAMYRRETRWVDVGCQVVEVAHSPRAHAVLTRDGDRLRARGWAFDPDQSDRPLRIRVMADRKRVGGPVANRPRPDVAAKFGIDPDHGFAFSIALPPGADEVCVWALDRPGNRNTRMGCV
ncbi:MAG: hypothetical protein ACR2QE_17045 [Acidimicrobiales bacterium]